MTIRLSKDEWKNLMSDVTSETIKFEDFLSLPWLMKNVFRKEHSLRTRQKTIISTPFGYATYYIDKLHDMNQMGCEECE